MRQWLHVASFQSTWPAKCRIRCVVRMSAKRPSHNLVFKNQSKHGWHTISQKVGWTVRRTPTLNHVLGAGETSQSRKGSKHRSFTFLRSNDIILTFYIDCKIETISFLQQYFGEGARAAYAPRDALPLLCASPLDVIQHEFPARGPMGEFR